MGAYSTLNITRADALKEILSRVISAPDCVLEEMLFDLVGDKTLYNFRIVDEYQQGDDEDAREYPQRQYAFRD